MEIFLLKLYNKADKLKYEHSHGVPTLPDCQHPVICIRTQKNPIYMRHHIRFLIAPACGCERNEYKLTHVSHLSYYIFIYCIVILL